MAPVPKSSIGQANREWMMQKIVDFHSAASRERGVPVLLRAPLLRLFAK